MSEVLDGSVDASHAVVEGGDFEDLWCRGGLGGGGIELGSWSGGGALTWATRWVCEGVGLVLNWSAGGVESGTNLDTEVELPKQVV